MEATLAAVFDLLQYLEVVKCNMRLKLSVIQTLSKRIKEMSFKYLHFYEMLIK